MNRISKIRHVELHLFVQYLIFNSIDIILDRDVIMNFQFVRAQIQHSLHKLVIFANHESIYHVFHFLQ